VSSDQNQESNKQIQELQAQITGQTENIFKIQSQLVQGNASTLEKQ